MCFVRSLTQFQHSHGSSNKDWKPAYTNDFDRSVNKVKTVKIHKSIKIHDCRSRSVCSPPSWNELCWWTTNKSITVILLLRKTKFSVQWDKNASLFTRLWLLHEWEQEPKYMCVSELGPRAGVVVNHARKYRFTYTGLSY